MAKLQAKAKEQQDYIKSLAEKESCDGQVTVWEDEISYKIDSFYDVDISFDTMAEIVDYLRGDECLIKVDEPDLLSKIEYMEIQRKVEDYDNLLNDNRKLFNECERLKKENATLKEKTKNLPRIATLNKRIHELKEKLKKYEEG